MTEGWVHSCDGGVGTKFIRLFGYAKLELLTTGKAVDMLHDWVDSMETVRILTLGDHQAPRELSIGRCRAPLSLVIGTGPRSGLPALHANDPPKRCRR